MHPTIPFLLRRTIADCEFGGYPVPANTVLLMTAMQAHYDTRYWTNPTCFDPERFSPARTEQNNHSFAFFPFGGGAHKCIGMHFAMMLTKAFMHHLLSRYRVTLPTGFEPQLDWVPLPKPSRLPLALTRLEP